MLKREKSTTILFIFVTLGITWIIQFIPILLGLNVENTSISSFDYASLFFILGGMMPSLVGGIFVLATYQRDRKVDFFKRCFIPSKPGLTCILLSLFFICLEVAATQLISSTFFHAEPLKFEGLKLIATSPLMVFYFLFWGIISGPLSEELGWRGFLQEKLLKNNTIFKTSVLIGGVWGIWHLPLFFYPAQIQYTWLNTNIWLAIGFILNCITNSLVYSSIYILSNRSIFSIFFLHMFENIILTGAMIYPFSDTYSMVVIPTTIIMDILFYICISKTNWYKENLKLIKIV